MTELQLFFIQPWLICSYLKENIYIYPSIFLYIYQHFVLIWFQRSNLEKLSEGKQSKHHKIISL